MTRYAGVVVGADHVVNVKCDCVLPGLLQHESLNWPGLWTLTQQMSGLALVDGLDPEDLPAAISVLSRVRWERRIPDDYMVEPEYVDALQEARLLTKHEKSKRQEQRLAREMGGKRQPASGSRWGNRRDVVTPRFLVEAKTTEQARYSVVLEDFAFLRRQAYQGQKTPAYIVEMQDKAEVVMVPYGDAIDAIPTLTDVQVTRAFTKKSVGITLDMVQRTRDGTTYVFDTDIGKLVVLGYEQFLALAKWGQDA